MTNKYRRKAMNSIFITSAVRREKRLVTKSESNWQIIAENNIIQTYFKPDILPNPENVAG